MAADSNEMLQQLSLSNASHAVKQSLSPELSVPRLHQHFVHCLRVGKLVVTRNEEPKRGENLLELRPRVLVVVGVEPVHEFGEGLNFLDGAICLVVNGTAYLNTLVRGPQLAPCSLFRGIPFEPSAQPVVAGVVGEVFGVSESDRDVRQGTTVAFKS